MTEIEGIKLDSVEKAYDFVNSMVMFPCDMDLEGGQRKHIVDAKSIMGVLSLDLTGMLTLKVGTDDEEIVTGIQNILQDIGATG